MYVSFIGHVNLYEILECGYLLAWNDCSPPACTIALCTVQQASTGASGQLFKSVFLFSPTELCQPQEVGQHSVPQTIGGNLISEGNFSVP